MSTRKRSTKKPPPPQEKVVKATKAQIHQRVAAVHRQLVLGRTRAYILQYASSQWECSVRTTDDYIARAREMLKEQTNRDRDAHLALALARLDLVFVEAYEQGVYKDALGAQHQLNKIMGFYAPTKHDVRITWEDEAVSLIKDGTLTYEAALETFDHDDTRVRRLFAKAQVPVSVGEDQG